MPLSKQFYLIIIMMLGASTHIDQVFHMFTTQQLQNLQYT